MKQFQLLKGIKIGLFLILILSKSIPVLGQEENLSLFDNWIEWSDGKNMLIHYLNGQAFAYLDDRDKEIAALKTKEDWINRQKKVKEILNNTIGPFPEKTPLNSKITGVIKKDGYRIEKVIFESMPGFYVTGILLLPDKIKGKAPAVIEVHGHGFPAFRNRGTQMQLYNLVKRGFVVFAIDPLGQGERIQYWDDTKKTSTTGASPVSEHSYFGNQMIISGVSPIRYFVWDGIRAVDYLLSRKEVDGARIGIYGCSGGGTQATLISAFDERIKASAVGCYITGFRRLLQSIGPQDAEQNIYHGIKNGITHADLLELRAPSPLLISSTTRDYFSIQGAVESYQEVRKAYQAFGNERSISHAVDDAGHGFARNMIDIYAFFQKELALPGITEILTFEGFKPEELQVTPTGQLATSFPEGETAFSINKKETQVLIDRINSSRKNIDFHLADVRVKATELSGYLPPEGEVKHVFRGRYQRNGYSIEMYALHGQGDYVIPLLLFVPGGGSNFHSLIYVHPDGKATDALMGGNIEKLVKEGYMVAAPDVLGTGETADNFYGSNYVSFMTGRSIAGIQAGDIGLVINYLKSRNDIDVKKISGIAFGEMGPAFLHAAALNPEINSVTLVGSPVSYRSIVMNKVYEARSSANLGKTANAAEEVTYFNYTVAGSLTAYDLPDLIGCISPRKIALVGLTDHMKKPASQELLYEEMSFPVAAYAAKNGRENLRIIPDYEDIIQVVKWCFE